MILINKVTPFVNQNYQKDLFECLINNSDVSFISNIIVFCNNTNVVLPKTDKVKLVIKNGYTDREIIEYCKRIYKDEIFIFSNPFIKFNNSLINLEMPVNKTIKIDNDCYIFNKNIDLEIDDNIDNILRINTSNNKISIERKNVLINEENIINEKRLLKPRGILEKNIRRKESYLEKRRKELSNRPNIKLDIIIVSVNYNDFLSITLKSTTKVSNVTVVTSSNDILCQELCKEFGANCVITERMYEDGAVFNKGKAINEGIKSLKNPEWILLLDADIYLQPDFLKVLESTDLPQQNIVICKRLILDSYELFLDFLDNKDVGRLERAKGFGYFQMFNINNFKKDSNIFPEDSNDASWSDLTFRDRFNKNKTELNTTVLHLGKIGQNWEGRKTEIFTNNLKEISINEWGVVSKFTIKESKYGKLNIENPISFKHHNGGWSDVLSELYKINNKSETLFDCFLEKNFSWKGSKNIPYTENWIGILHNPIDSASWYMNSFENIDIFESTGFLKSLEFCKGLYTFSEHESNKVKNKLTELGLKIKVENLKHSTKKISNKWSFTNYNSDKKIVHIGWWLRNIDSFYNLKISKNKIRLKLNEKVENQISRIFNLTNKDVEEYEYLKTEEYEKIITSSIVYINLIDAVAVNTILECIERNTPILTNRNKSIEEYLGEDYPLFYDENSDFEYLTSDSMLIKASKYLNNLERTNDLGRQIEDSDIYKSIDSEFNIKTIFEPGDLDNSKGGIYNPGFCEFNNKKYIISRVENLTESERGNEDMWIKTTAVPYITELDEYLNITESIKLDFIGEYKRIEDFRLFKYKDKLYSNHILIDANRNIKPVISEVNLENKTLSLIGTINLDFKIKEVEKNWVFFEKGDKLYLIYSVNPMIVYEINIEDLSSKNIKNEQFKIDWEIEGYLSSSTNPIKVSDDRYIMGIHTRDRSSIYHQGFLVFDDEFNIIKTSNKPYISGGDFNVIHENVMYTSSIFLDKNLICFAGDGDTKTISIEIKNNTWKELL